MTIRLVKFLSVLVPMVCLLPSCITPFEAYIRNLSNETAVIEVTLLNKSTMRTLPNQVKVSDSILSFKAGFRKNLNSRQLVVWQDTSHFKLFIRPHTTIDLTDLAGKFRNSNPREDLRVLVISNHGTDTLLNGRYDFRHNKFGYKKIGLSSPLLYYDLKE